MTIEILPDAHSVARRGAQWIAEQARTAIAARGQFVLGVSGGTTPSPMLRELALAKMNWHCVDIIQVDERVAPAGDADRNLTALCENLGGMPRATARIHAMPVESEDLADAAKRYSKLLESVAGTPPVLDLAQLGLGADGHTASLVPGDPALDVADADVAWVREYQGRARLTLTYPILNRARQVLWLVTGSEKAGALARLLKGDRSIPAGRVRLDAALVLADRAAAGR
jgi:6-phosphogluconolactonase